MGKAIRHRLYQNWGVVDIEDIENGVRHVIGEVLSLLIELQSGVVVPAVTRHGMFGKFELFSAGASYYGISDLEILAQETHKFEAHYSIA